jgi:hypothetical protein
MVGSNGVEVKNARYVIQNSWTHGVMVRDIGRYISIADILTEYRNRCWVDDVQRFIDETLVDTGLTEKLLVHLNDTPTCDYHKMLISNVVTDMLDYHDMFFSHVRAKIECHNRSYIDVPYC